MPHNVSSFLHGIILIFRVGYNYAIRRTVRSHSASSLGLSAWKKVYLIYVGYGISLNIISLLKRTSSATLISSLLVVAVRRLHKFLKIPLIL